MPLVRTEIDLSDIIRVMHSRGYGDHYDGRYALSFNKKDPSPMARWKMTNESKRVPIGGGVSKAQLKHIQTHSESAEEAADRVEAVILGKEMLPIEAATSDAPPIDTGIMEKMVENRTDAQIGRHLTPIVNVLNQLTDRLEAIERSLKAPAPEKKNKGGRPKGSKNKKKDADEPVIDFGPRVGGDVTK